MSYMYNVFFPLTLDAKVEFTLKSGWCAKAVMRKKTQIKKTTIGGLDLDSSNIPASVLVLVCQRHPRAASKTWVLLLALYGVERQGVSPSLTKHNTSSGSLVFLIHYGPVPNPRTECFFVVDQLIIVATAEWVLLNKRTASRIGPDQVLDQM